MNDPVKLKIMSYNIWFDDFKRTERLFKLLEIIKENDPDVVCLQEVLNFQYETIKDRVGYKYFYPNEILEKYGCVILSKYEITKSTIISLPSNMGRNLILIKISVNDTDVVIGNVHFESEFNEINYLKKEQYKQTSLFLNKLNNDYKNIIFCSDTNVTNSEETYFDEKFKNFKDSWEVDGKNIKKEYTYDFETNKNLQLRKIKLKSRIDRILFKNDENMQFLDFNLIMHYDEEIEPSDHHGIISNFNIF